MGKQDRSVLVSFFFFFCCHRWNNLNRMRRDVSTTLIGFLFHKHLQAPRKCLRSWGWTSSKRNLNNDFWGNIPPCIFLCPETNSLRFVISIFILKNQLSVGYLKIDLGYVLFLLVKCIAGRFLLTFMVASFFVNGSS